MNRNRKVHITGLESQNYFSFTMKSPDIRTKVMIDDWLMTKTTIIFNDHVTDGRLHTVSTVLLSE